MVDHNVGRLARWLRMMGYDTRLFTGDNDSDMVTLARREGRIILTRDTQIMKRRLATSGEIRALLMESDEPEAQMRQVITTFNLNPAFSPFSLCLECNQPLEAKTPAEVAGLAPPFVFKTQQRYMMCPQCQRIYWRGTHWRAMTEKLKEFRRPPDESGGSHDQTGLR
jgi:uncharacterized protein with PIN domain